jgi:hypothetical protein
VEEEEERDGEEMCEFYCGDETENWRTQLHIEETKNVQKRTKIEWREEHRSMRSDGNECNNTHHVDYKCSDPNEFLPGTKEHRDAVSSRVAFRN